MDTHLSVPAGRRWTDSGSDDFHCVNSFKLYAAHDDQKYQGQKVLVLIYCSPITEVISKVDSRLFQDEDNEMLNVLLLFSAGFGNQDIGQVIQQEENIILGKFICTCTR